MANGTKELNTSPITILDEIDEFSDKPVMSKTLAKALKDAGGGMPADYPYEAATLFEGNVEYENDNADIEGLEVRAGTPITITINDTKTDLFYDGYEGYWSDTNPSSPEDTIKFGNGGSGEDPAWLWMKDAPDGTYAVKIEGDVINENFENAVEEIVKESPGGVLMIHCEGTAVVTPDTVLIPTNCSMLALESCLDLANGIFKKPIFIHLPVIENFSTGDYSYINNKSAMYMLESLMVFEERPIATVGDFLYALSPSRNGLFVLVAENR